MNTRDQLQALCESDPVKAFFASLSQSQFTTLESVIFDQCGGESPECDTAEKKLDYAEKLINGDVMTGRLGYEDVSFGQYPEAVIELMLDFQKYALAVGDESGYLMWSWLDPQRPLQSDAEEQVWAKLQEVGLTNLYFLDNGVLYALRYPLAEPPERDALGALAYELDMPTPSGKRQGTRPRAIEFIRQKGW